MNERHMSVGLKNVCSNARAPGARRKITTRMPSTTIVLTEEMTVALVPPLEKSRGPRPVAAKEPAGWPGDTGEFASDRKSTRLNSSHTVISYAVFCLKKKTSRSVCGQSDSHPGTTAQQLATT